MHFLPQIHNLRQPFFFVEPSAAAGPGFEENSLTKFGWKIEEGETWLRYAFGDSCEVRVGSDIFVGIYYDISLLWLVCGYMFEAFVRRGG